MVTLSWFTRVFCVSAPTDTEKKQHHKILIIGGGTGGIAVASRLSRKFPNKIALVEPSKVHFYQPMWTLVGSGLRPLKDSFKPMSDVLPRNVKLIQDRVTKFEPEDSRLVLSNGQELSYDYLVLALGMSLRYEKIPGAVEALEKDPRVCSNYSFNYVPKTVEACRKFSGGHAVFTLPSGPVKCAGASQKIMYMFEDSLRRGGKRDGAEFDYFTAMHQMFTVDRYAESLAQICKKRDIRYHFFHNLVKVDHTKSEAVFENVKTKELKTVHYDLLHITPPMSVPDVLKNTPKMCNPAIHDYVNVDPNTLQHKEFKNVFALGDCAALPTSKTAAAVCCQSDTVSRNLCNLINGGKGDVSKYDGYTACPFITARGRGILAEFNYKHVPLETSPLDQSKDRFFCYFMKTVVMPPIYWHLLIKGRWSGPKLARKILHFGFSE
ncbi:unnamed protein product [Calicophoron daubneyi]|uniref:Sulfide:quinone oxidoreductase, mitochondrial n=1 Tax=Calicophoron daubneyi TaxID=300641 RepID=A0AAV2T3H4_CALDB